MCYSRSRCLTNVRTVWRVEDFLDGTDGAFDVGKLCHGYLGGQERSEPNCHWIIGIELSVSHKRYNRKQEYMPSVTMPNVPSAPIKSFVVSKPAADFLARLLVLTT